MSALHASRKMFLDTVAPLSEAQWNFKPAPEIWSAAEIAEHIATSEEFIPQMIKSKVLSSPAAPDKRAEAKKKDEKLLAALTNREQKFQAPEMLQPKKRFATKAQVVDAFKTARDGHIRYIETSQDPLRDHFMPHPALGDLDAYQWYLLVAGHAERHVLQMRELIARPDFPKK